MKTADEFLNYLKEWLLTEAGTFDTEDEGELVKNAFAVLVIDKIEQFQAEKSR